MKSYMSNFQATLMIDGCGISCINNYPQMNVIGPHL